MVYDPSELTRLSRRFLCSSVYFSGRPILLHKQIGKHKVNLAMYLRHHTFVGKHYSFVMTELVDQCHTYGGAKDGVCN